MYCFYNWSGSYHGNANRERANDELVQIAIQGLISVITAHGTCICSRSSAAAVLRSSSEEESKDHRFFARFQTNFNSSTQGQAEAGIEDEGQGREMFSQLAEFCSHAWRVVKNSWQMLYVCYPAAPTRNHLHAITKATNGGAATFTTISFIQITKLQFHFTFACMLHVPVLHWGIFPVLYPECLTRGGKGRKTFLCGLDNESTVALCQVTVWGARVWKRWCFPHEKYYWLELIKDSRWNSPDSASLHGCGYGHGFVDVVGKYSCNQTVVCVVGSFYHFLDSFELHDHLDWSKNLIIIIRIQRKRRNVSG